MSKRTFKEDKLAKIYDAERSLSPLWSRHFGRTLLRDLVIPPQAMVLDTTWNRRPACAWATVR
ncbi:MAG: hypothetical protein SFX73_00665 [Kofleriaceae bacterium]|nr:hypothetical protein [Kofleriaceae bacterium]